MKTALKIFFAPLANRHYTNKKTSVLLYVVQYIPVVMVCVLAAIAVDGLFWIVLAGIFVLGVVDYLLLDAFLDKLNWRLFWRHFYKDEAPLGAEHQLMKEFENNPTPENRRKLARHITTRQRGG